MIFMGCFVFIARQSQICLSLGEADKQVIFFLVVCVIICAIAAYCALSALATRRAVIQADRALELEQAHQELGEAYAGLVLALEQVVYHYLLAKPPV